jgi:hypothetical protein
MAIVALFFRGRCLATVLSAIILSPSSEPKSKPQAISKQLSDTQRLISEGRAS